MFGQRLHALRSDGACIGFIPCHTIDFSIVYGGILGWVAAALLKATKKL